MSKKTTNSESLSAGTHLARKENRSGKLKKIGVALLIIVLAAVVIGLNVYNSVIDSGYFARKTVAVSSENYSLSSAQMSYYFYTQYQNMATMYSYYGLDMSQLISQGTSLKLQQCTFSSEGESWFDYFMSSAVEQASQTLVLCEAAKKAGIELDDADYAEIDAVMDQLKEGAESAGMSLKNYIKNNYGSYVREGDIEEAVKLEKLSDKYSEKVRDDTDTSNEALEKNYNGNKNEYDIVSYLTYTFDYNDILDAQEEAAKADSAETSAEDDEDEDEDEVDPAVKNAAVDKAKLYADKLALVNNETNFKKVLKEYFMDALLMTEEEADKELEKESFVAENVSYNGNNEQIKWAFTEAKVGDAKCFDDYEEHEHVDEDEDDEELDIKKVYTVLLLTKARGRDESISSRDVHHILFSKDTYEDDTKVNEVYDKWVKDGASLDEFKKLAKEYSEDPGSVDNGGLYEGVKEGDMVDEFNDWLFDEARVEGDHGIVKTTYGWHIMYYAGGIEGWKAQVTTALEEVSFNIALEEATKEHEVTVDNEALDKIPG